MPEQLHFECWNVFGYAEEGGEVRTLPARVSGSVTPDLAPIYRQLRHSSVQRGQVGPHQLHTKENKCVNSGSKES